MGVPKFFRYMSERYPCLSEVVREYQIPEYDNLYLDMNGIIHICSHPNDLDPHFRISEEKIFRDIFHYIEILFHMIQPQKLFFMAVDGVAPRAKMNQQRGRRFRSAKEAEVLEAKAKERGEVLPKEARFDSNCITPGTVFMTRLNEQLKYFVTYKITTDKLWQKCKVILSGHETPGEGEHKIMDYIRYIKSQSNYDSNTRHCLYGLDADLIMLGLCTHEPHFSLLREEIKFGNKQKRVSTPEETTFFLLHLSVMREYIEHEFSSLKDKLSFDYDIEKIIDDWVLMGFLVGNDFIPNLPNLHIANGALPILYLAYMEVLPTLDGYINEGGTLKLDRFEKLMERLSRVDIEQFAEHYADLKYFESKTGRRPNETERHTYHNSEDASEASAKNPGNKDLEDLIKSTYNMFSGHSDEEEPLDMDDDSDNDVYNMEFIQHKRDYYMNKLEYENVDADVLKSQAECYVRAIQWNLNYYYNGCCSWSWYYPHHYAPYISDIKGFKDLKLEFDMGRPFLPFQQLLAVLPAASRSLLPKPFESLMIGEQSPIIDYYPAEFKTDLNGKRQEWEAVVLIPFIEETSLLEAMEPCYAKLTPDEKQRNSHGPMYVYYHTTEDLGLYEAPQYFPKLSTNHAKLKLIKWEDIIVPREKLVKGLCPGIRLDVYFPGFPTLKHINHTAELRKAKVKVFEQVSRGENMILQIVPSDARNLADLAGQILGTSIFVSWPHLVEARVVAVSNREVKYTLSADRNETIVKEEMRGPLSVQWNQTKRAISENYMNRLGIDVGETDVLVHACLMTGRRYIFGTQGKLSLEKQWSDVPSAFALQATVGDIAVHDSSFVQYKNIGEVFTPKSICFMLGHPHYGAMGEVSEGGTSTKTGRVKLAMWITEEPNLDLLKQSQSDAKSRYMHGSIAAQRLGINSHLLSRITGSIYVMQGPREQLENPKRNLGLNLKFNKKNQEVPGYTKKVNGQWLYSAKAIDLIRAYMRKFPLLFEKLASNVTNDIYYEDELFTEPECMTVSAVSSWLKEQPFYNIESCSCGTESLDFEDIEEIERVVDAFIESQKNSPTGKTVMMQVKPHLLFKPSLHMGNFPPDATAQHKIYDRVVSVRENFTVPLGYRGTIFAIPRTEKISDLMYDIVFDKEFVGGLSLNMCSANRGYRLAPSDFINLSHGFRAENVKSGKSNVDTSEPLSWRSPSNSRNHTSRSNTSAFALFNSQGGLAPAFVKGEMQFPVSPMKIMKKNSDQTQLNHKITAETNVQDNVNAQSKARGAVSQEQSNSKVENETAQIVQDGKGQSLQRSSEFQALWNELHRLQKSSGSNSQQKLPMTPNTESKETPSTVTNSPREAHLWPQDPSAFLKAMLKISDDNSKNNTASSNKPPAFPQLSKSSDAPPLVQQLFDHARQVENTKKSNTVSYCSQLLTYFQLKGMGMPRYSYSPNKETNFVCARIFLPNGRTFGGEFCQSRELAAESAAKRAYTELDLNNIPDPGVNILPTPPQQWYNTRHRAIHPQNIRPIINGPPPMPPMMVPNPFMSVFNGSSNVPQSPNNSSLLPTFSQTRPQQRPHPGTGNSSKNWRTENNKSEQRKTAAFVPLQAQKQHRSANPRNITGTANLIDNLHRKQQERKETETNEETTSKVTGSKTTDTPRPQNIQNGLQNSLKHQQKSAKQRRSRIAANFGSVSVPNGAGSK
ncbi:5'-3' exoribonuclease 1 isoform X1 [Neodiprion lecontei]|uniref:5'-3' exoribonuclease 1 n=1 Tax=Neodiprion lecontei TaxID=441921 RepID=A0ABM3G4H0_NEOLC|nr:5'-3' exoribonuclease 1 isoform X1 [Neodiprion lecontei]